MFPKVLNNAKRRGTLIPEQSWSPEAVKVANDEDQIGLISKTEISNRKFCKKCGSNVMVVPGNACPNKSLSLSLETEYTASSIMTTYFDLGTYSRPITTASKDAKKWFDRGLLWCFGYNHDESVACHRRALEFDPIGAMAWWGIAYSSGCNYNKPWEAFDQEDALRSVASAHAATNEAMQRLENVTPLERALISALPHRYPTSIPADDMNTWNDNYANAMREVYNKFSTDFDVVTLFAEAIMNRTPWALWDLKSGKVAKGADTLEAVEVLEKAFEQPGAMEHPGLLHIYIHLMEMSPHPERALKAGDALRGLVPDAGHLNHMPDSY